MSPLWGLTDAEASRPTWINLDTYPAGTTLIFVDEDEAQTPVAKLKGIKAPGWYLYYEYDNDADPVETRYKTELVVAARVSYADAGDDVADNTILTGYTVYVTTQPEDVEVTEGDAINLVAVAESNPAGAVTYQWQKLNVDVWEDIAAATAATYTIAVSVVGDSGEYRVAVTAADTTTTVFSEAATVLVNP